MLADVHDKQVKEPSDEELYRKEYGSENVDAFLTLLDNDHERALAFANIRESSKDANHRLTTIWLKAMIARDLVKKELMEKEYQRLITFDPEINSTKEAEE